LKTQITDERQVKRRWRKITGESGSQVDQEVAKATRTVISLKDLVKRREQEKQAVIDTNLAETNLEEKQDKPTTELIPV